MRKSYLLYAMGAGLAFSACSSEENLPGNSPVLEKDKSFYVNVAITTNADMGGTRANSEGYDGTGNPDFEKGLDTESVVNNVYFVFYDANGLVVGQPVNVSIDDLGEGSVDTDGVNILRSYTSIVKVDVSRGESEPQQVMCYVNPVATDGLASSLQRVETITRNGFNGTEGTFAMSNSVYYQNSDNGTDVTRAVEIGEGQLFESMAEAEAAVKDDDSAARVVINVERYASKVKFSFGKEDVVEAYTPANNNVTLTFVPEKWEVNATDKNTFVTKAFRSDDGLGSPAGTNMNYGQVVTELDRGTDWTWNAPIYTRSYWAFSPAYYSNEYPYNAHDVKDNEENYYALNYLTYNQVIATTNTLVPSTTATIKYTNETTVSRAGLDSSNPAAAIASVVLAGHYEVAVAGTTLETTPTFYTVSDFESTKPQVLFGATLNGNSVVSTIGGTNTVIEYLADKESALLVRTGTEGSYVYSPLTKENLASVFNALTVGRPSNEVFEGLGEYAASRKVTLQISNLNNVVAGSTLCINLGNGPQEIGEGEGQVSVLEANKALVTAAGYADMYNEGRAYFNIPIRHLGWYAGDNPNATAESIDYSAARVGDFGLVRNHVYNIVVNSIKGLATAIADPSDPIVPPVETKDYFVAYRLNILNWAIVPVQNVDL